MFHLKHRVKIYSSKITQKPVKPKSKRLIRRMFREKSRKDDINY